MSRKAMLALVLLGGHCLDALPARNDALRGAGNFESALQALEAFRAEGFEPKVLVIGRVRNSRQR